MEKYILCRSKFADVLEKEMGNYKKLADEYQQLIKRVEEVNEAQNDFIMIID